MVKRNLIANYLGQGWSALMGLAFVPLYIRFLGIEAYGLIGFFAVLQAWLVLLDLGMSPTLGREMARFTAGGHTVQSVRDMLRSLELVVFGLAAAIILLAWSGSGWLAAHWLNASQLPIETMRSALSIIAFVVGLRFCEGIYRSALIGLERQVWFNAANALLTTLRSGGAVLILAFVSRTIEAFFIWQGAISALTLLIFAFKLHRSLPAPPEPARFSSAALRPIWAFARGMLGINLLAVLLTQIDKVLLSKLLSLEDYGYYMLAGTVAMSLQLLISPITQALYPRLVALHELGNEAEFARLYHLGAQLVTLAVAPISLLIVIFPHAVLYVWSADASLATATAPILVPLMLGTFLNCLVWMPYQAQLAHGWTSLVLAVNVVAVAVFVPAILLLVPDYGARAAAQIWLALNVCYVLFIVQLMHRRILRGEMGRWFAQDVLLPVGAAGLTAASLGMALSGLIEGSRLSALFTLGAMAVALYAATGAATPLVRCKLQSFIARLSSRAQGGRLMAGNAPKASIGLPVYNAAASVGRTIDSLLAQTMTDFELIISDNASTDGTGEIARAYAERDSRIRYVRQKRNIGAFPNFAAVLRETRGEYFMWAAADDHYALSHLEDLVRELDENTEAVAAMSATVRQYADGRLLDEVRYDGTDDPNSLSSLALGWRMATGMQYHFYIYGLYRRRFLASAISSILPVRNADRLFVWRIALGHRFRYTGKATYFRLVSDVPAHIRYRSSDPSLAKLYRSDVGYIWTVLRAIPYLLSAPHASLAVRAAVPIMILRYMKFLAGSVLGEMQAAAKAKAQQGS